MGLRLERGEAEGENPSFLRANMGKGSMELAER
jgi:hypothetical protein